MSETKQAADSQGPRMGTLWPIVFCGAALVTLFIAMTRLSERFILGQGHEQRPIEAYLGLFFGAFVVYLAALWPLFRFDAAARKAGAPLHPRSVWPALSWIVLVAMIARAVLLPSQPIQEIDYARYLWDGAALAHGHNPYRFSPQEVFPGPAQGEAIETDDAESGAALTEPERATLAALRALRMESPAGQEHHHWINYPHVRTIYPPLAQAVFTLAHVIAPWSLIALRVLFGLMELGALLLLIDALRRLGLSPLRVAVYAWSPLAIKELANSAHLDAIVVFCLALAIWTWVSGHTRWLGVALGAGVLAKTFPVLLLPAAAVAVWRRYGLREACVTVGMALGATLLGYAPFVWTAGGYVFEGHARFAADWESNAGLYLLLVKAAHAVVAWTGGDAETTWTLLGKTKPAGRWLARGAAGGLVGLAMLTTALWPLRSEARLSLIARWLAVLATLLLCAPTGNPWYATWLLPFLCFVPIRGLLLLTGLIAGYYVKFITEYRSAQFETLGLNPRAFFNEVRWAQYLPVYVALWCEGAIAMFRRRKADTQPVSTPAEPAPPPEAPSI